MDGLTAVLEGRTPGRPVKLSEVRTRIPRHASSFPVVEVVTDLELLEDGSTLTIRSWIEDRTQLEGLRGFAETSLGRCRGWLRSGSCLWNF
ncbi:hypothetical protein ACF1GT_21310 [Streptomyces sp. NPDC014636]|uniref:hypothetical protein n=1 Tax=Streptomyces sp. NPDC014636 TaxID=3364876 RepID=UPI0036F9C6A8